LTRLFSSTAAIALLFGTGCNLGTDPIQIGSTAGDPGSYQELAEVEAPGAFVVDENYRGTTTSLRIERISWGRLVDIADAEGVVRHRDFVVNEGVQSGGPYVVETNPITDKTTVKINFAYQSASYISALDSLDDSLGPIFDKSLDVAELPPFPIMPRNAAISVQFNDLLDVRYEGGSWEDSSSGLLVSSSGQLNPTVLRSLRTIRRTSPMRLV
jgi:hypothetical protein